MSEEKNRHAQFVATIKGDAFGSEGHNHQLGTSEMEQSTIYSIVRSCSNSGSLSGSQTLDCT